MPGYRRTAADAVPVFDQVEADYFVEIAPPCATAKRRQTDKHVVQQREGNELQRVTIYCDGQKSGTDCSGDSVRRRTVARAGARLVIRPSVVRLASAPETSDTTASAPKKIKNRILAIPAAPAAMLPKPNAATSATMKKAIA